MKCLICNLEFKSINRHLKLHNISQKEYYDKYFKKDTEGICITCGKETPFLNMKQGYQKHCSCKCAQRDPKCNNFIANNPQKNPVIKQKTAETNIKKYGTSTPNPFNSDKFKNNMIKIYGVENPYQLPSVQEKARKNSHTKEANEKRYKSLLDKIASIEKSLNVTYIHKILEQTRSSGWYQSNIVDIIKYDNLLFVNNSDIQKIFDYDNNMYRTYSITEKKILFSIENIYKGNIFHNTRKIINPLELDIYIPDLKIAVEYNGIYFHSSLAGTPKDYHLNKSIKCRKKGIRLIHIYEFEDIDKQIELLKNLILGTDNYIKDDFNKNNLISNIPEPQLIFDDGRLQVYGAGFLK